MVDFEELKKKHPRMWIIAQGVWIIIFSTIIGYVMFSPFLFFGVDDQILVDIFTFPADFIPPPYNWTGLLLLPPGMFLVVWANYTLLHIGRISLRDREPMQRPSTLVQTGPFIFTRNPIYLGNLIMLLGLVIVWSSIVTLIGLILIYFVFKYFIKREEIILEEEFGEEYRDFKNRVRRWL
ncbi:MAG: methyltransferase family protein [Candidatus Thorarchaeota archaeon]